MNKPTKKQHYVPQIYLRGFSSDEEFVIRNELESQCIVSSKPVPIQSICREDFLYEIKDSEGSYIALNFIENTFQLWKRCFQYIENS
jgi:hypothetical protein